MSASPEASCAAREVEHGLSGCRCVGVDCVDAFDSLAACEGGATSPSGPSAAGARACRPRPTACPEYYSPVCGCDDVTHDNPCFAQGSGTDVAYEGACATPADCRTLGCAGTSHCDACLTPTGVGWVCLPAGAVC